jgi:hypothetical protein
MNTKLPHDTPENEEEACRIIKNLKTLLTAQHKNLAQYIDLAEKQKKAICSEEMDKISVYMELENRCRAAITACDKAFVNWHKKYEKLALKNPDENIEKMYASLQKLQERAYRANARNRALVKEKLVNMKKEIAALSFKPYNVSSPYKKIGTPSFIDITS